MDRSPSMPVWKKVLFGILTLALFFAGTELALSLIGVKPFLVTEDPFVGFAGNVPLFVEQVQPDGAIMLVTARNKIPLFNEQQFPKVKGRNSYRIFCMGASTTYGHPFYDSTSFCGWLREFLYAADPSKNWEVINAGGVSYASYRVANLMNELSQYQPDLFIVYSGQNEFLEERTYHNIKEIPEWVMRTKVALSKMRTYTVINRALDRATKKQAGPSKGRYIMSSEENAILNRTIIGPTAYTRNDRLKEQIIAHYTFNLKRMIEVAKSAGSKIVFVTPASMVKDTPPFKSENRAGMTDTEKKAWTSLYNEGKELQEAGKSGKALEKFNEALTIDNRHADLHFRVGQVLFALKRFEESKISFQKAIDEDICPLRILSPMSKAVHEIAEESKVPLIDFVKHIEDDCYRRYGHKIPGNEYFIDHVHPTIEGNGMLGLSLLEELARQGIVRTSPRWNNAAIAAVRTKVEQSINPEMKFRGLRNLAMTINWTHRWDEADSLLLRALQVEKDDKIKGLIYKLLGDFSLERGRNDQGMERLHRALAFWPDNKTIRSTLAGLLQRNGRLEDALSQNYEILRIIKTRKANPGDIAYSFDSISVEDSIDAHGNIAHILSTQGQTEEAISHYTEALKLKPDEASIHTKLGVLLAKQGRETEAIPHLITALKIKPDSSIAHYNLGIMLDRQGRLDEAGAHYSEVLRIEPKSSEAHNNLGVVLAKQGKIAEAAAHFSDVLKVDPGNVQAHYNLGLALSMQGRKDKADFHFSEAKRLNAASAGPESGIKH